MEFDVAIDSMTDCLVHNVTGMHCDTEFRLVRKTITKLKAAQFTAKSGFVEHYRMTLGAKTIGRQLMYLDSYAAVELIKRYFGEL